MFYNPDTMRVDDNAILYAEVTLPGREPFWQALNLNNLLGNNEGRLMWGSGGFHDSIWRMSYRKTDCTLLTELRNSARDTVKDSACLSDFIRLRNGVLIGPTMKEVDGKRVPVVEVSMQSECEVDST
jgi:hypothetical protein